MIVEIADLEEWLGHPVADDLQTARLLAAVERRVVDATGQQLTLVEEDEVELPGVIGRMLLLPQRPVLTVQQVVIEDPWTTLQSTVPQPFIRWRRTGEVWPGLNWPAIANGPYWTNPWGGPDCTLRVTYSHGYTPEEMPETIKSVICQVAARQLENPTGVASESTVSYAVSYAGASVSALSLNPSEIADLQPWSRNVRGPRTIQVTR